MTQELVKLESIEEFVRTKDLKKFLTNLVKEEESNAATVDTQTSKEKRLAKWTGARETIGVGRLTELRRKMTSFVTKKFAIVDVAEPRQLTAAEALLLMDEFLAAADISEALEARRAEAKRMVFESITTSFADQGIDNPEHHNGSIPVPELGKKFCREGTGKTDPILNPKILEDLLSPQDWNAVTTVTTIPAHTERILDENKLAEIIHADPRKLEILRQALIPGSWKIPRFQVRDL
jgi:hypothetical protein